MMVHACHISFMGGVSETIMVCGEPGQTQAKKSKGWKRGSSGSSASQAQGPELKKKNTLVLFTQNRVLCTSFGGILCKVASTTPAFLVCVVLGIKPRAS
jgi:hypothetical protein